MLTRLIPKFDRIFFTRYRNNPRGVPATELAAMIDQLPSAGGPLKHDVNVCIDPQATWQAVKRVATPDCLICITGSFFIAAEMRQLIVLDADWQQPGQDGPCCRTQSVGLDT